VLKIDDHQIANLRAQRQARFETRLFDHARSHFRQRCAHIGDAELRRAIRSIIDSARGHGLRSELAVCLYFNVAVCFGMDFLANPQIRWAHPIGRVEPEVADPAWMLRVSEIAGRTLKQYGR
jgi:hypothetical protein